MESDREEHLAILDQDREQLKTQNRQLNAANRALSEELKSLEEGWGWIDVARKNHGMIRSGEMVFRFPDKSVALRGEPRPR